MVKERLCLILIVKVTGIVIALRANLPFITDA